MLALVTVNHEERDYFSDGMEMRTDMMRGEVTPENVRKAIDKLVRRFDKSGLEDVMFVQYADHSGYRLMYETVGAKEYMHPIFGQSWRGGHKELRLRHYTNMEHYSWDTDETVTKAEAKRAIVGHMEGEDGE